MNNQQSKSFLTFFYGSVFRTMAFAMLLASLLFIIFSLVIYYQEKQRHIEQSALLMATSAATVGGADLIDRQVTMLLDAEPSVQSILFYSTNRALDNSEQTDSHTTIDDWKNALLARTVNFDYPVTSFSVDNDDVMSTEMFKPLIDYDVDKAVLQSSIANTNNSNVVGYINLTLDMNALRLEWLKSTLWLWALLLLMSIIYVLSIRSQLKNYVRDMQTLSKLCQTLSHHSTLEKLPVFALQSNIQELTNIKIALTSLFDHLQAARYDHEALIDIEQQLRNKELTLDIQRYNFQSMITHELKTSLNAVIGGLQLLDNQKLNIEQQDTIAMVTKGAQQLASTLQQIMQLNQLKKGQVSVTVSEFNPLQLMAELIAEFDPIAKKKGLILTSSIHHIDYSLVGDTAKIKQILSILLGNAIKFTASGQVGIQSQLTHFSRSNRWQVVIQDAGIGIETNHIDDIFDPFFQVDASQTRQYEGTGLGLPVVKQVAQLIGATIKVHSTVGVGSAFTVTMPMPNHQKTLQKSGFSSVTIIYYYYQKKGHLVDELADLGVTVICERYEKSMFDHLNAHRIDALMFAEDLSPVIVESLTRKIRQAETDHRVLLVYWYSEQQADYLDSFEHGLKSVGIDYCHNVNISHDTLENLLDRWLSLP